MYPNKPESLDNLLKQQDLAQTQHKPTHHTTRASFLDSTSYYSSLISWIYNLSIASIHSTKGGAQKINCANSEGIFRIIQSIPSPKAEPFKRWLAKVGYERIQEIEDPEFASRRTHAIYKDKGYSDNWIEKRMCSIAIRDELTEEWKKHDI